MNNRGELPGNISDKLDSALVLYKQIYNIYQQHGGGYLDKKGGGVHCVKENGRGWRPFDIISSCLKMSKNFPCLQCQ